VLVAAWEEDASTLDPSKTVGAHELRLNIQFCHTLWGMEGSSTDLVPWLASSWSHSEDGLTWTVDLRPDVTFHDGTPCNADAVKWSFDRWLDPNHPYHDPPYGVLDFLLGGITNIEKLGDLQLRFTLEKVDATFEEHMLDGRAVVVSPTAVEAAGSVEFGQNPVGSGPFKFSSWEKGVRIVFDRYDGYWGETAKIDQLIVRPIVENAARLNALQQGEVDLIVAMSPEFIPIVQSDPNLQLLESESFHIWWVTLNMHEEPMQDVRVRQALNYAVNKQAIADTILQGAAALTGGPIMSQSWGNDPSVEPYPYDPEQARALLTEAGYAEGFATRFWVPESGSGMIAPKEIAQIIQADLQEVGVQVELLTQEWTSYVSDWASTGLDVGNYGMAEMSWNPSSPDPADWLDPNLKGTAHPPAAFNGGYYANGELDDLLERGITTLDRAERVGIYQEAQRLLREDCPWIFMFSANNIAAATTRLKGVELNPNPWAISLNRAHFE
jgi:peptide/nickel transport system substrate-binding protein